MSDIERSSDDQRGLLVPVADVSTGMWIVRVEWNPPTFKQFRTYAEAKAWCDERAR